MNKVLISVAPVAATDTDVNPRAVAEEVLSCAEAGAGMVHLHVRDRFGRLTADLTHFEETISRIRERSDIVIEASTGGVSQLTIQERCAPLALPKVECASLNVGSCNLGDAVYQNPAGEVEYCVRQILSHGKTPEAEVFEIGMIDTALDLCRRHAFRAPLLLSIVLGHRGAAPATVQALTALRAFIPDTMLWGITHYGRLSNDIIMAALAMGAVTVRLGFEDSRVIRPGQEAARNVEIVRHFAGMLRDMDKEPMTPAEARAAFGIQ